MFEVVPKSVPNCFKNYKNFFYLLQKKIRKCSNSFKKYANHSQMCADVPQKCSAYY